MLTPGTNMFSGHASLLVTYDIPAIHQNVIRHSGRNVISTQMQPLSHLGIAIMVPYKFLFFLLSFLKNQRGCFSIAFFIDWTLTCYLSHYCRVKIPIHVFLNGIWVKANAIDELRIWTWLANSVFSVIMSTRHLKGTVTPKNILSLIFTTSIKRNC